MKKIVAVFLALLFSFSAFAGTKEKIVFKSGTDLFREDNFQIKQLKGDSLGESIMEFIFDIILINGIITSYDEYPYNDGNFIRFGEDIGVAKNHWFTVETGLFSFPTLGINGNETRFTGYAFKMFGPVIENQLWGNLDSIMAKDSEGLCGNLKIGGEVAVFQTNPVSVGLLCEWTMLYGGNENPKNGVLLGTVIRSYPAKPVLLQWRFHVGLFPDDGDRSVYESHLEIGLMPNGRVEIYGAWKWIDNEFEGYNGHGFAFGGKVHF